MKKSVKTKQPIKSKVVVQVYKDDDVSDICRLTFEVWFHKWADTPICVEMVVAVQCTDMKHIKALMWEAWKASWMIKHQMGAVV
jgi:hypothetical protein